MSNLFVGSRAFVVVPSGLARVEYGLSAIRRDSHTAVDRDSNRQGCPTLFNIIIAQHHENAADQEHDLRVPLHNRQSEIAIDSRIDCLRGSKYSWRVSTIGVWASLG